jgi:hypothetical protein
MSRKFSILFTIWILIFAISACNIQTGPTSAPTQIIEPVFTQPPGDLPLIEAEVPRVSVDQAKTALDSGAAIIVDVRGDAAYQTSHITGAISIPLGEIETNVDGLNLDKDQWMITYCT